MHAASNPSPGAPRAPHPEPVDHELIDEFLTASRVLVAVAARSLADLGEEITLPQYRALVVLSARGSHRVVDLAEALGVTPGTASRMIERLTRKGLVRRARARDDRRTIRVDLTDAGREIVSSVTARRREEIARILAAVTPEERAALTASLTAFASAAGEAPAPGPDFPLGWEQ